VQAIFRLQALIERQQTADFNALLYQDPVADRWSDDCVMIAGNKSNRWGNSTHGNLKASTHGWTAFDLDDGGT